jgi:RNA polymerase sigma-70 factor (ECF subfamily)
MSDSTRELLMAWHRGDQAAFTAIVREHTPWIEQLVHRRLGAQLRQRVDTQDVVQNTLIEVLRDGPRFVVTSREHLRGLLARMVENVLRANADHARAEKRDVRREVAPPPGESVVFLDARPGSAASPSQAAAADEERVWVRLAIELLAPDDRIVVIWREYQGLSFAEVAHKLGIDEDAARMRFNRALPKLARKLEQLRKGQLGTLLSEEG